MKATATSPIAPDVDAYLQAFPEAVKLTLENVRQVIRATAPLAQEVISYQVPGYKYLGPVVYFAGYKNHCSLFVINKEILKIFASELRGFKTAGATIHFTFQKPLPNDLIRRIVQLRLQENEELDALKKLTAKNKIRKASI
ncbi:DUF1801 domain-containing protein [Adhaeribacter swui]|uniref:DUF1801 domain-containing protein n=1 Tax=Adhaeribacter swui TaxID=2086471 RepID=A0A7G7GA05_9BACT|nr:DUF1801 domain-containing protein [Adhaeribacter swui]QNF33989.1 DUF1801 domain-containing protein [Adhaeribacter swui]